jgi:hypothetical protein
MTPRAVFLTVLLIRSDVVDSIDIIIIIDIVVVVVNLFGGD